ncbi:hypothetical protein H4R33_004444 [Dimargaris cristalligena]|nr:hypothetical protein H4R33_004444 [Dimargaris cristalligena]
MRPFGVTYLLILSALNFSHASEQNNQDAGLNNFIDASSPDIIDEDSAMHLIHGPLFRDATWQDIAKYIGQLDHNKLASYINLHEHFMGDQDIRQADSNIQDTSLDHIIGNHDELASAHHRMEASRSGSVNGIRPPLQMPLPYPPKLSSQNPIVGQA